MYKPRLAGVFYSFMKPIALLIKADATDTPAALRYANALVNAGNPLVGVFFLGKGVRQAAQLSHQDWRDLKHRSGVRLALCSASASKFNVQGDDDFTIAGLGELITSGLHGNRVVSFG